MKDILQVRFFFALAALTMMCGTAVWADPPSQVGRLSYIRGTVSFQPASVDEWMRAELNYPLTAGDHLWTDAGARAEVHVPSAAIRLNSNTDVSFLNLDDQAVQVRLSEGSLNVSLRTPEDGTVFEIDTPNATVTLVAAGVYRVDVPRDGKTAVTVRAGRAEVTAGDNAYDVNTGQSSVISGSNSISFSVTSAAQPDEWDDWGAGRDRRGDWVAGNPHVSRDMIGIEDLDENGTWLEDEGDGPAWTPSHVSADWAPYRDGHWTWVSPWGWTWVDDSAWGFAPFHYGRWGYRHNRWVWMPGAARERHLYAPALVIFVGGSGWTPSSGEGIGWFPLGPRELYIPSYTVSTTYVRRINVAYVTNINVQVIERHNPDRVVYVNRTAPRAVTAVPREVFVHSRPAGKAAISLSSAQVRRAPLMGMTARVVPQRESIIVKPAAQRTPVPQPPPAAQTRRIFARVAPAPAPVPFARQQKALAANPGRPVEAAALSSLHREQKAAPPVAVIVKPETLVRRNNTQAPKSVAPAAAAPAAAPARKEMRRPAQEAPQKRAEPAEPARNVATGPAVEAPQKVAAPAAPTRKEMRKPVREAPQKVAAPVAPAQKVVTRPAEEVPQQAAAPAAPTRKEMRKPVREAPQKVAAPVAPAQKVVTRPAEEVPQQAAAPAAPTRKVAAEPGKATRTAPVDRRSENSTDRGQQKPPRKPLPDDDELLKKQRGRGN